MCEYVTLILTVLTGKYGRDKFVMNKGYLWKKLGNHIQEALLDDQVTEVILNPDSQLWLAHRVRGVVKDGFYPEKKALSFVHALAQSCQQFLNDKKPYLDTCLPFHGERINVTIPPIVDGVSFNIRKKSKQIFTLADYVDQAIFTKQQMQLLKKAIRQQKNILVSGGPGAGKTTLTNVIWLHYSGQTNYNDLNRRDYHDQKKS